MGTDAAHVLGAPPLQRLPAQIDGEPELVAGVGDELGPRYRFGQGCPVGAVRSACGLTAVAELASRLSQLVRDYIRFDSRAALYPLSASGRGADLGGAVDPTAT